MSSGWSRGYDDLPVVNIDMVNTWHSAVKQWVEDQGFTIVKASTPGGSSDNAAAVSINNLMSPHAVRGGDTSMLTAALDHINLDDPRFDYDEFINLLRAICAACSGDLNYLAEVVWPWVCKNQTVAHGQGPRTEEQGIEWLEERWKSFTDSQLGADFVYGWAHAFGWADGITASTNARVKDIFAGYVDGSADGGDDQAAVGANAAVGGGSGSAGGGGAVPRSGPVPPSDTHWQLAAAFAAQYGADWRYNVDAKRWFRFSGRVWEACDFLPDVVGAMLAQAGFDIYQTVNGRSAESRFRALQSYGTINSVVKLMQGLQGMAVRESDFDAHPYLLNTPDGVIDLHTGAMQDHHAALLIRNITLVSPDIGASTWVNGQAVYEQRCPRFFNVLRNCATGREWFIKAARAWFA
jgi:hypothetical protein